MKNLVLLTLILASIGSTGCSSARWHTQTERDQYDAQAKAGLVVWEKKPGVATGLGFVPFGIGAAYTDNNVIQGTTQFLFWPVSIIWGPVSNWQKAKRLNYEATVVKLTEERKQKLSDAKTDADRKAIDDYYRPFIPLE
jgi:uncharacterized protein YceK